MHPITVAGHICLDLTPDLRNAAEAAPGGLVEIGPMAVGVGGSVANTALVLADLGAAVTPHATVGRDAFGELLGRELAARGLDTTRLTAASGASTSYSVVLERPGRDRTFWHNVGANALFDGAGLEPEPTGILHLGYPPLLPALLVSDGEPLSGLLARARAAGATTSVDLSVVDPASAAGAADWDAILTRMSAHTDVLSPSLDDLTSALRIDEDFSVALVDRLADRLLSAGVAVVAISAGRHGLFLRTGGAARLRASGPALAGVAHWADRALDVPALDVGEAVTTNGAGDAATAGLLFAVATGADLEEAGMLAVTSAAAVVTGRRAEPRTILELAPELDRLIAGVPDPR